MLAILFDKIMANTFAVLLFCLFFTSAYTQNFIQSCSLNPQFLRYNSTIDLLFTLEPSCPTESNAVFYSWKTMSPSRDKVIWQDTDFYSRPNATSILISRGNFSNSGDYILDCSGTMYEQLSVAIPVAPRTVNISLPKTSIMTKLTESEDNYASYYEFTVNFNSEQGATVIQFDVGLGSLKQSDGTYEKGLVSLSGDSDILSSEQSSELIDYSPHYPNGTRYRYLMDANLWAKKSDPRCTANLSLTSYMESNSDMWHEAVVFLNLRYKPQNLRVSSSAQSSRCEIFCEVDSACPFENVEMTLDLWDNSNSSIAKQTTTSSRWNRVEVIVSGGTCEKLINLAKDGKGYAVCTVKNAVGSLQEVWKLKDVEYLSGLVLQGLEWWEILLIAISATLLLILIVVIIVFCYLRSKKNGDKKESKREDIEIIPPTQVQQNAMPMTTAHQSSMMPPVQPHQQQLQHQPPTQQQYPVHQYRPASQAGSSYYEHLPNHYPSNNFSPNPVDFPTSNDYRTVAFDNTPRSRQPVVSGPGYESSFENSAFQRSASQRSIRSVRSEAYV